MNKRNIRSHPVDYLELDIESDPLTNIDEVIDYLNDAKKKGCTFLEFSHTTNWDWDSDLAELTIQPIKFTEETDDQLKAREEQEIQQGIDTKRKHKESQEREYKRLGKLLGK